MESQNFNESGSDGSIVADVFAGSAMNGSMNLKTEFAQWHRASRISGRHLAAAEKLGGRVLRMARWERGMVMLRGIHLELAKGKATRLE